MDVSPASCSCMLEVQRVLPGSVCVCVCVYVRVGGCSEVVGVSVVAHGNL